MFCSSYRTAAAAAAAIATTSALGRHLQCAYLRFSPAEQSFYDHILAKTAAAKQEMEQQQQPVQEGAGGTAAAAAAAVDHASAPSSAAGTARAKRGRARGKVSKAKAPQDLQQLAADQIAQLRRACVHAQLTRWAISY